MQPPPTRSRNVDADAEAAWFETLAERVHAAPGKFADTLALAGASGVDSAELTVRTQRHAHLTPEAWLVRARLEFAARLLGETTLRSADIAEAAGFTALDSFARAFDSGRHMGPAAYRAFVRGRAGSRGAPMSFVLRLPAAYRATEVLGFHARDPAGLSERVSGRRLTKALTTRDGPAVLEITLSARTARCRVQAPQALGMAARSALHGHALRLLGLKVQVEAFESQARQVPGFAAVLDRRIGLRLPLMADAFEALCWAIIGQQINVAFATSLRRTLIERTGTRVGDMLAHPTPERLAALDENELTVRHFSRAKARYLVGAARAIVAGALEIESLAAGSAVAAEQVLTNLYGVGTWTARYTLMRGAGLADCAPIGDVALAAALQKWRGLPERPTPAAVEDLLRPFSPFRSLATGHLWASLKDEP